MKKIGEYTARGAVADRTQTKISLFDGQFDTGYKVTNFRIWSQDPETAGESVGVLKTDGTDGASLTTPFWNAADNTQIGWAAQASHVADDVRGFVGIIDPDNLIVEDLFITAIADSDGADSNYMIWMDKYDISEWQGALAMVRSKSQDV